MNYSKLNPLVSIIIPTYNRENFIDQTMDSVLSQTYENWECIVVDDGSADNTKGFIQARASNDKRIKFTIRSIEPKGAAACRNIGLEKAEGDYVLFLDSDDCISKKCLEYRVHNSIIEPDLNFWVYQGLIFNQIPGDLDTLWNISKEEDNLVRFLKMDVPWQTSSVLWKKSSLSDLNGFEKSAMAWQDWELHIRALLEGYSFKKYDVIDHYIRKGTHDTIGYNVGQNIHNENILIVLKNLIERYNLADNYKSELRSLFYYLILKGNFKVDKEIIVIYYKLGVISRNEVKQLTLFLNWKLPKGKGFIRRRIYHRLGIRTPQNLIDQETFQKVSIQKSHLKIEHPFPVA